STFASGTVSTRRETWISPATITNLQLRPTFSPRRRSTWATISSSTFGRPPGWTPCLRGPRCATTLAGRSFEVVTVDVGFSDPPVAHPERLRGPDLLSFAEIAPIEAPALPLKQHVAEKVHAYTRTYACRPS